MTMPRDTFPTNDGSPAVLTVAEVACVKQCGALAGMLASIVGHGASRDGDMRELIGHVHAIQQAVLSNAAGRAYPEQFRLLGGVIAGD